MSCIILILQCVYVINRIVPIFMKTIQIIERLTVENLQAERHILSGGLNRNYSLLLAETLVLFWLNS